MQAHQLAIMNLHMLDLREPCPLDWAPDTAPLANAALLVVDCAGLAMNAFARAEDHLYI